MKLYARHTLNLSILSFGLLLTLPVISCAAEKSPVRCPVVVRTTLKKILTPSSLKCFSSTRAARDAGYTKEQDGSGTVTIPQKATALFSGTGPHTLMFVTTDAEIPLTFYVEQKCQAANNSLSAKIFNSDGTVVGQFNPASAGMNISFVISNAGNYKLQLLLSPEATGSQCLWSFLYSKA